MFTREAAKISGKMTESGWESLITSIFNDHKSVFNT
jgi:hypothetical protein